MVGTRTAIILPCVSHAHLYSQKKLQKNYKNTEYAQKHQSSPHNNNTNITLTLFRLGLLGLSKIGGDSRFGMEVAPINISIKIMLNKQ